MHTPKGRDAGSENGGILPRPRNAKNAGKFGEIGPTRGGRMKQPDR